MNNIIYKFYCYIHKILKLILGKSHIANFRMVDINHKDFNDNNEIKLTCFDNLNSSIKSVNFSKSQLYPVENIVPNGTNFRLNDSFNSTSKTKYEFGVNFDNALIFWNSFITSSKITEGYKNSGFHYAGFILDNINKWCLPSWIWTNATLVKFYFENNKSSDAIILADLFLEKQQKCGGWIVRNDYTKKGPVPTLAPNDSAYIANHSCLTAFKNTNQRKYLESAIKCANWIIETSRHDGLVLSGYDLNTKKWVEDYIIVDTGFTAAFFANLYELTNEKIYLDFLKKFIYRYIFLFYNKGKGFVTSIDSKNNQVGGYFSRGQAWALEGLIPSFNLILDIEIKIIIDDLVSILLKKQLNNGGWSYNLSRPFLGEDCKGVPVIAKSLADWNNIEYSDNITNSIKKSLRWCMNHTVINEKAKGGIFSFNMEGAIVHNHYSRTAFVYSTAYAVYVYNYLKKLKN